MNNGIASASGEYIHLTQDDIVLENDCIERLVKYMQENPSADLISPIIYNKNLRTILCAGGEFVLGGIYRKKVYGVDEPDHGQFPEPFDVSFIDGATMFASRGFWQRFKGFREEYFMYVEAVELSARVVASRSRMTIVPQARVYHFEPPLIPTPAELEFHKLKNLFSLYLLHARARHLPEFFCRYAVINGLRSLFAKSETNRRVFFKALLWVVRKTPSLLNERYQAGKSRDLVPSERASGLGHRLRKAIQAESLKP
jgi:GT2 family glycosyltransferase